MGGRKKWGGGAQITVVSLVKSDTDNECLGYMVMNPEAF